MHNGNSSQSSKTIVKDISFEATLIKIANHPAAKNRAKGEMSRHEPESSIAGRTTKCTEVATVANGGDGQTSKPAYSVQKMSKKLTRYQQPAQTLTDISEAIRAGEYKSGHRQ